MVAAIATEVATKIPWNLKATKNKITGIKLDNSFMEMNGSW
jgi:hypothetical protein